MVTGGRPSCSAAGRPAVVAGAGGDRRRRPGPGAGPARAAEPLPPGGLVRLDHGASRATALPRRPGPRCAARRDRRRHRRGDRARGPSARRPGGHERRGHDRHRRWPDAHLGGRRHRRRARRRRPRRGPTPSCPRSSAGTRRRSSADEVARAVVESVAENTVDAVVAPVLWAAVARRRRRAGPPGRQHLDAMVGHHSDRYEQFGWASARLDDLANWVPARVTAAARGAAAAPPGRASVWRAVRARRARATRRPTPAWPRPRSPPRSICASAGVNRYGDRVEDRAALGRGRARRPPPTSPPRCASPASSPGR